MKTVFEIGISMDYWVDEELNEFPVYQVTLNVTGKYGCTSMWEHDLFSACWWCINAVYDMAGQDAYDEAQVAFQKMFPNDWERFTLPF